MTGPEHYREAERLLAAANRKLVGNDAEWLNTPTRRGELRADARIHATLAHAAATALAQSIAGMTPIAEFKAWAAVAGEPAPEAAGQETGQ